MARTVLVTGGCRSGKSRYALELAGALAGRRVYVATCPVVDDEMRRRIARHRKARKDAGWDTVEEPVDLLGVLEGNREYQVVLVDCLTLWISNLMHRAQGENREVDEDEIAELSGRLLDACRRRRGTVILVTNEVGMGVVPANAVARRFRDLVGRCNQVVAAGADEVILMTSGIPLHLKGRETA